MKIYMLRREQIIHRSLDEVFAFFERPDNLADITPPKMGFNILTPQPLEMRAGAVFDYVVTIMGINQFWRTLIEQYDPPHSFVDIQLSGPYRLWHHTHQFESHEQGTLVRDIVRYILPFGPVGRLAHPLVVRPQLERIFTFRNRAIDAIFPIPEINHNMSGNSVPRRQG